MEGKKAAAVRAVVEPTVQDLGFDLIFVEIGSGAGGRRTLRLFIDSEAGSEEVGDAEAGQGGVTIADCAAVSREVSALLDVEDPLSGAYVLEVSSPGLDRPLARPKDFERYRGRRVRLRTAAPLDGRRKWAGVLVGMEDGDVVVEGEDGAHRVPLEALQKANIDSRFDEVSN